MPVTVSPKGEAPYVNLTNITFTWAVSWVRNQAVYELAWKRASESAWNSSGNINQSASGSGQGSHTMPIANFVPNVRYTWRVRLRSSTGSDFYRSGWSDIGMFVLTNTQMGLLRMDTGSASVRQLRGVYEAPAQNHSRIQLDSIGRLDEVAMGAENASEVRLKDSPTEPVIGKRWEIAQGEPQGPGGTGYNDYSNHSDTAYSQYYNYYDYYNYYNYYNYNVYSRYGVSYYDYYNYCDYCDYSDCDCDCCDATFCEFHCDSGGVC